MKKLNKTISFATEFAKWYADHQTSKYNSSNNEFYSDVLYELLIIQEGLCAYTEYRLVDESILKTIKKGFANGKYNSNYRPQIPAQIEHFSKQGKLESGWNWDNLFAAFTDINLKKNKLEDKYGINEILKPDSPEYSPSKYLRYDAVEHIFTPLLSSDHSDYQKVFDMIIVLGLNNDFIKMKRREYLEQVKFNEEILGKEQAVHQFHTAYETFRMHK